MVSIFSLVTSFYSSQVPHIFSASHTLRLSPLDHVLFHALFDFHPFHCDKRSLTLLYCFAANILIHGAFICTSLIKSKNDNEAAGDLRCFFKSNWHTENLPSTKPTSWLEKKQVIFFPIRILLPIQGNVSSIWIAIPVHSWWSYPTSTWQELTKY